MYARPHILNISKAFFAYQTKRECSKQIATALVSHPLNLAIMSHKQHKTDWTGLETVLVTLDSKKLRAGGLTKEGREAWVIPENVAPQFKFFNPANDLDTEVARLLELAKAANEQDADLIALELGAANELDLLKGCNRQLGSDVIDLVEKRLYEVLISRY